MQNQSRRLGGERGSPVDDRWADLADLALIIAREIQFRGYTDERAVSLSPSEGMVMRHLLGDPAAPPSRIAAATGLQRTNLSTVLRGQGRTNYALVRQEWATAVAAAAGHDTRKLDAALTLLSSVEAGLVADRSGSSPT
jgi:hypothetical protein